MKDTSESHIQENKSHTKRVKQFDNSQGSQYEN